MTSEARDLLALHLVPGLGPRLTTALLRRFGSAGAVLRADIAQLQEVPHIGPKLAHRMAEALRRADVDAELERMTRSNTRLLVLGTPDYPERLTHIPDPPHLLYLRGTLRPDDAKAVAIVGSRNGTSYGRRIAERLAADLVHAGYTVISGLARGTDSAAHRGALEAGGRTLAILAGGLSKIYPPEHTELAQQIERSGALLSESSMTMEPMAGMFPARNRIISGLAQAVVIVEAAEKSGALITASHALEQGRTVFAVPGPVDSPASAGTLKLLRQGAIAIRGVDDIREELEGVRSTGKSARLAAAPADLDDLQRRIWDFLAEKPRHIDEIVQQLQVSVQQVSGALLVLEMKKCVCRQPGNLFERR